MAILIEPKLALELRVARELRLALELRLTREVRVTVRLNREPTAVTVSLRLRPCSVFLGADSSRRRTTSTAFSSSMILGCLESWLVAGQAAISVGPQGSPLRKVFRILVKRIVTAENVDECQDNLVRCVVHIYGDPANTFVTTAKVDFIKNLELSQLRARKHESHSVISDLL